MKYKIIYILLLTLISFPVIDNYLGLIPSREPLKGDFIVPEDVAFSSSNVFSESFQQAKSERLKYQLNAYPAFVRLYNQVLFSTFKTSGTFNVVIGKDDYIFDKTYIEAYLGADFIGEQRIEYTTDELALFQKVLQHFDKDLIVCFVPGKASFYPDKFPSFYDNQEKRPKTNLSEYISALKRKNIRYIDLSSFLLGRADTSVYNLYPKNGIHLSTFGTVLAADSLVKYIADVTQHDIPKVLMDSLYQTQIPQFYDDDIQQSLNLLFPLEKEELTYPAIKYTNGKDKLKVTTIGDSFYKYIHDSQIHNQCFNNGNFWFYGKKAWPLSRNLDITDFNVFDEFIETDVYLIFASEATLYRFPYSIKDNFLSKLSLLDADASIKYYTSKILKSPEWKATVTEKANNAGITFEEQCLKEAKYLISQGKEQLSDKQKRLISKYEEALSNPEWFEYIANKAEENHLNVYTQTLMDARYIIDKE